MTSPVVLVDAHDPTKVCVRACHRAREQGRPKTTSRSRDEEVSLARVDKLVEKRGGAGEKRKSREARSEAKRQRKREKEGRAASRTCKNLEMGSSTSQVGSNLYKYFRCTLTKYARI